MRRLVLMVAVCLVGSLLITPDVQATNKKKDEKKSSTKQPVKKSHPKRTIKKVDPKQRAAESSKRAAELKKKQEESAKKRAAERKAFEAERAKKLAELKKKHEEENKKREAASLLARRRSRTPRLVQDLIDERQIGQIETLQKRLDHILKAKYAEQKKIFERSQELRKEIDELRAKFDEDVARTLKPDQQKTYASRKAELEKKRKEFYAKRAAAFKEAQKKREAEKKKQ